MTEARVTLLAKYADKMNFNSTCFNSYMIVNQIDKEGNFAYEKME